MAQAHLDLQLEFITLRLVSFKELHPHPNKGVPFPQLSWKTNITVSDNSPVEQSARSVKSCKIYCPDQCANTNTTGYSLTDIPEMTSPLTRLGSFEYAYINPPNVATAMKSTPCGVILAWKTRKPMIRIGILFRDPTMAYVVADVAATHQSEAKLR